MAFFIVFKSKLSQHHFEYLDRHVGRRLEATLVPNMRKTVKADESVDTWVVEVMSKKVKTLRSADSVQKAINLFNDNGFHHIPLVDNDILVGMISARDIMWKDARDFDDTSKLNEFMKSIVVVCNEDTPLDHLARVFYTEKISGMPVINDDGHLVGMVTHHDILRWVFDK